MALKFWKRHVIETMGLYAIFTVFLQMKLMKKENWFCAIQNSKRISGLYFVDAPSAIFVVAQEGECTTTFRDALW